MRTSRARALPVLCSFALALAACGSSESAGTDGVATLESADSSVSADGTDTAAEGDLSAEEAALAFSECMRDEGVDFPDIGVDADGNIQLRESFAELDPTSADFRTANETCQPLLADAGFGAGGRAAIGENVEIQDALVEFSDCIRDEGFDVGDLTLGGPGAGAGAPAAGDGDAADGEARGAGQRQGGFGDPSERLATQLGLDVEDPDVSAAIESCSPILDTAFADQGIGQQG